MQVKNIAISDDQSFAYISTKNDQKTDLDVGGKKMSSTLKIKSQMSVMGRTPAMNQ